MKNIIAYIIGILTIVYLVNAVGLNCTIVANASCDTTKVLFMKNDTAGYFNAHAQNTSNATYPFTICCNSTITSTNLSTDCTDNAIFLRLSNETNAHVQKSSNTTYPIPACLSAVEKGKIFCNYFNDSCNVNFTCLTSIASSEGNNDTNAHVGSCDEYKTKVCCRLNSPPNQPILLTPTNGNTSITNRSLEFTWNATDPENDTLTFDLFIDCKPSCSADNRQFYNISTLNYTLQTELNYFGDDNNYYEWKVRAYDNSSYSINSTIFNFSIQAEVILTLINATVDFGTQAPGDINDTTDNNPDPFLIRNDGNSFIDINISADDLLWDSEGSPSAFFQYKADNDTSELNSFNYTGSTTTFTNVPTSNQTFLQKLNYSDAADQAEIDLRIEVPATEPAGDKSSTILFTGQYHSLTE